MLIRKNKYKNYSDEALMNIISDGNIAAFDEIYVRYSNRLLHYFYRMLGGNEEIAQDFLQNIFFKVVDKPDKFPKIKNFSSWIFTIAFNMCKNEYRNRKVRDIFDTKLDLDSFTTHFANEPFFEETKIDQQLFEDAILFELNKMDEVQRSTFLLRYQENFTIKEISNILECSEGTTKSRLFYTLKKLAEKLQDYNPNIVEAQTHEKF